MATKIILDVDTGADDAVALMTAALSPDIELVGATVVNGNTVLDSCVENTLRVVEWIGMPEIPVHRGMSRPLARPQAEQVNPATRIHGDKLDLPEATITAGDQHAVDWLIDTYLASDGDITLVPVGPLTNIATAIQKEPRILEKIPEIVIMGGAHDHGNSTASAEFNIWLDPEAARGRRGRLRPADPDGPPRRHASGAGLGEDCDRLRRAADAGREAAARSVASASRATTHPADASAGPPLVHDALTVCAVIDPSVSPHTSSRSTWSTGGFSDGRTVCDFRFRSRCLRTCTSRSIADGPKFVAMLVDILGDGIAVRLAGSQVPLVLVAGSAATPDAVRLVEGATIGDRAPVHAHRARVVELARLERRELDDVAVTGIEVVLDPEVGHDDEGGAGLRRPGVDRPPVGMPARWCVHGAVPFASWSVRSSCTAGSVELGARARPPGHWTASLRPVPRLRLQATRRGKTAGAARLRLASAGASTTVIFAVYMPMAQV